MKFYHFAVLRESTIVLTPCLMLLKLFFGIAQKHHPFKHAIYCCPSINNAIGEHFRRYSAKTYSYNEFVPRSGSPKLDVMVIFKRKILNKGCVFTNHVRNVDDSISAHERCAPGSWHTNQLRRVHDIISAHGGCAIDHKGALVISAHGGCASDACRTNQPRNAECS